MTLNRAKIDAHTNTDKLGIIILSMLGIPGASKPVPTGSNKKPANIDQIIAFLADIVWKSMNVTKGHNASAK